MFDFVTDSLNPEQIELMKVAFEMAWQFVQSDTVLEPVSMPERQAALAQAVIALGAKGETHSLQLANEAIAQVRKVCTPSPSDDGWPSRWRV